MKTRAKLSLAAAVIALLCAMAKLNHAADTPSAASPQSMLWLVGDSTLHAYHSHAEELKLETAFDPTTSPDPILDRLQKGQMKKLDVTIPVKAMKSGKEALDKNMQKALKAEANPAIQFHMDSYQLTPSTTAGVFVIKATGPLSVAGAQKNIELTGHVSPSDDGIRIEGAVPLLMTDFGIKPPVMLILKTDNHVVIHYDIRLDASGKMK